MCGSVCDVCEIFEGVPWQGMEYLGTGKNLMYSTTRWNRILIVQCLVGHNHVQWIQSCAMEVAIICCKYFRDECNKRIKKQDDQIEEADFQLEQDHRVRQEDRGLVRALQAPRRGLHRPRGYREHPARDGRLDSKQNWSISFLAISPIVLSQQL